MYQDALLREVQPQRAPEGTLVLCVQVVGIDLHERGVVDLQVEVFAILGKPDKVAAKQRLDIALDCRCRNAREPVELADEFFQRVLDV